jgi:threonine dehydrogenase-like Zn-dependent dehydrogenase
MEAKAAQYTPDGDIEITTAEVGDPGPGEVQVKVSACGICAWDVTTCKLGRAFKRPAPPGHEGVGYVTKVGEGVAGLEEGDRVAGGGFAEYANLPASKVYPIPEDDRADEYWIVEPVSCAVTGLDHCRLKAGDRIAVVGCGFMGLLILQGLLHSLAVEVVGLDISAEKLQLARQIGVEEVYNVAQADRDELVDGLKAREFDCVVDTTGSNAGFDLAAAIVRRAGLINLFGWIKGESATFDPGAWHAGGFTIVNSSPSARLRDPFPPAIDLMARGVFDLQPLVTDVVPLEEYPDLMDRVVEGDSSYVKGVVDL